jgi:hypothetical protein
MGYYMLNSLANPSAASGGMWTPATATGASAWGLT